VNKYTFGLSPLKDGLQSSGLCVKETDKQKNIVCLAGPWKKRKRPHSWPVKEAKKT